MTRLDQAVPRGPELDDYILVLDDDAATREMVSQILYYAGYRVDAVADGLDGLAALERKRPALILLDMRMPVMNGWEFAGPLQERGVQTPVAVMTAGECARLWAEDIRASGYLSKPFEFDSLLQVVDHFLPRR